MLLLFILCYLIFPPLKAAQISMRLLGSYLITQGLSMDVCGRHHCNWHPLWVRFASAIPPSCRAVFSVDPSSCPCYPISSVSSSGEPALALNSFSIWFPAVGGVYFHKPPSLGVLFSTSLVQSLSFTSWGLPSHSDSTRLSSLSNWQLPRF